MPLNKTDQDFIDRMVPHHREAVAMARKALPGSSDPRVRALMQGVIASQEAEIHKMIAWGANPAPGDDPGSMGAGRSFPEPVNDW